jgi:glycosyltransferase involved in cell wall biosynthesis
MDLVFITDARFHKGANRKIYSQKGSFGPVLWKKYLSIFDRVYVLARVEQTQKDFPLEYIAESDKVFFIEIPYYVGPVEYLRKRKSILKKIEIESKIANRAYLCRVPSTLGSVFAKYLRKNNIPYAVEVVGDPWDVFAPGGAFRHIFSPYFRISSYYGLKKVVRGACSALYVTKKQLQTRYPTQSGAYTTHASNVYIPDSLFNHSPKKYTKVVSEKVIITAVGSLSHMTKSPDIVLKAMKMLKEKGVNFHLIWLGGGIYKQPMVEYADELGLSTVVDFLGNVPGGERVRNELKKSDLFIHASRAEGLPRAVIEAMSVGLPCIGTAVNGIPELLDKVALIPPRDANALANKIEEFLSDPSFMNAQGERNFAVAKHYRDSVLRKRREEFYGQIIKRSKQ